jgi:hypothetical protein
MLGTLRPASRPPDLPRQLLPLLDPSRRPVVPFPASLPQPTLPRWLRREASRSVHAARAPTRVGARSIAVTRSELNKGAGRTSSAVAIKGGMALDCSVTSHRSTGQPTHLAGRYRRRPPTHSGRDLLVRVRPYARLGTGLPFYCPRPLMCTSVLRASLQRHGVTKIGTPKIDAKGHGIPTRERSAPADRRGRGYAAGRQAPHWAAHRSRHPVPFRGFVLALLYAFVFFMVAGAPGAGGSAGPGPPARELRPLRPPRDFDWSPSLSLR